VAEELGELRLGQHEDAVGLEIQRFHHYCGVDQLALR
jgi:hypothetical protein